jgi:hypothetical protein
MCRAVGPVRGLAVMWWVAAAVAGAIAIFLVLAPIRAAVRESRLMDARRIFHTQREWLEARFITLAGARLKPDAPRWLDCEFDNDVAYVRNRSTKELAAFVAITVTLEDVAAGAEGPTTMRSGTAVFRFESGRWKTDGAALLNLSPFEAVRFYRNDFEIVAQEMAQ